MNFEGVPYYKKKFCCWFAESVKAYYRKIMELPDSTDKIAKGVALGLSFDFLPVPVISIPLSYLAARLTRCNPLAAVGTVIFFKLAVPFFFTLNILTGKALLRDFNGPDLVIAGDSLFGALISKMIEHGYPYLLGSMINALLAWLAAYFLIHYLLKKRRQGIKE